MQERRIPTLLGFFLILAGVGATVFGVQQFSQFRSQAQASEEPKEVKITNVTDKSFSVTWLTDSPTIGFVTYGPNTDLGINVDDDRKDNGKYTTHQITITGLDPATKYFYKVGSGAKLFDQNGSPFEATTASSTDVTKRDIVSGFVVKDKSEPVADALVTFIIKDSLPLSTLTNQDGQYRIDLSQARDKNLFNQFNYDSSNDFIDISVKLPGIGDATAVTTTANSHPVPPITIGGLNDFTKTGDTSSSNQTQVTITPVNQNTTNSGFEKSKSLLGIPDDSSGSNSTNSSGDRGLIKQKSLDALGL